MRNYGLIIPKIITKEQGAEHIFGSANVRGVVINPSGNWRNFLPSGELQNRGLFEDNACASFGTNNAIETLVNFTEKRVDANYSDRALAIGSGTEPTEGADPHSVAEYARNTLGFADESVLPFNDSVKTLDEFYSPKPLTQSIIDAGNKWFKKYSFRHGWIWSGNPSPTTKITLLKDALQKGSVCVSVSAWFQEKEYYKPIGYIDNHFVQLVKFDGENPVIFDSYADGDSDPFLKTLTPLYDFSVAKFYYLTPPVDFSLFQKIINLISKAIRLISLQIKGRFKGIIK